MSISINHGEGRELKAMTFDEIDDHISLGGWIHILPYASEGIEGRGVGLIHMTVAFRNIVDDIVVLLTFLEHESVHSEVGDGVVSHDCEGGNVAVDTAATLDEHPVAYMTLLMDESMRGEYGVVADVDIARDFDCIAEHTIASYLRVMTDMRLSHDEVVVAYRCLAP